MDNVPKIDVKGAMLLCQIKPDEYVRLVDINNNSRFSYRARCNIQRTKTAKAIVHYVKPHFAMGEFVSMEFGVDGEYIK